MPSLLEWRKEMSSTLSLFRQKNYSHWFFSDTTDLLATSSRDFFIPLIAFSLTQSESFTGLSIALASFFFSFSTFFGGTLADIYSRKKMLQLLSIAGTIICLLLVTFSYLRILIPPIFLVLITVLALVSGLLSPANNAILKSIISDNLFTQAQAIRESRESILSMVSTAFFGFIYKFWNTASFLITGLLHALSGVFASQITIVYRADAQDSHNNQNQNVVQNFFIKLWEGLTWSFNQRIFLWFIFSAALSNIATTALFVNVQIQLISSHTDTVKIALVDCSVGFVMFLGSLIAVPIAQHLKPSVITALNLALFTICTILLMLFTNYWATLIFLAFGTFLFPADNAAMLGYIYSQIPNSMQGRADSVLETVATIFSAITPIFVGFGLQTFSASGIIFFTIICIQIIGIFIALLSPLREIPIQRGTMNSDN
ncbi:MFS transporter [Alloscardovia venturai]|uniref:MFS transporter n=1 Tax=Alloscardovia venturai TaxID=1769421 RepID=A0ABW2Y621_9BIFI